MTKAERHWNSLGGDECAEVNQGRYYVETHVLRSSLVLLKPFLTFPGDMGALLGPLAALVPAVPGVLGLLSASHASKTRFKGYSECVGVWVTCEQVNLGLEEARGIVRNRYSAGVNDCVEVAGDVDL